MGALGGKLYDLRRQLFGRYVLDDPRPIAASAPYTYFLPPLAEVHALRAGDLAQLTFRSIPSGRKYDAERMWVRVSKVSPGAFEGTLESDPSDMPQLAHGRRVPFQAHHVIDLIFEGDEPELEARPPRREYWDRCLVDDCVLNGERPVGYVYREEPVLGEPDDKYPDSGWRIRGDLRDQPQEEIEARTCSYVALGPVLNQDDSWLHLIDEPIGSAFDRDFENGGYVEARD
jgi:hypothetical protein